MALPGVVLPAGSYSFDTPFDNPNVVIVRNMARSKVFYTGFTTLALRPAGMLSKTVVTLGEVKANEVPPVTAWYEIGGALGHEFRY